MIAESTPSPLRAACFRCVLSSKLNPRLIVLTQVEYAIEAIKLGSTAIGIQTSEGVVLAVEKRITSPLMEASSIEKIVEIDNHIACAYSGLTADSKTLIDRARVECQNHWFTYDEKMQVGSS